MLLKRANGGFGDIDKFGTVGGGDEDIDALG